jgi:hypothetical protein
MSYYLCQGPWIIFSSDQRRRNKNKNKGRKKKEGKKTIERRERDNEKEERNWSERMRSVVLCVMKSLWIGYIYNKNWSMYLCMWPVTVPRGIYKRIGSLDIFFLCKANHHH